MLDYIYCQMSYSGLAWVIQPSLHNIQQLLLVTCMQVELLCGFLSSAHLLRNLQPTNIKDLAQTMLGRACSDGELIYRQGDAANNFYILLRGEVVMYETDAHTATSSGLTLGSQQQQQRQGSQSGASRGSSASGGKSQHGAKSSAGGAPNSSSPRVKTAAGNASATASIDVVEVRRIGPREAFGEDDISAGSKREQSAVAGNTSNHSATLALIAAGAGPAGAAAAAAAAGTQAAAASSSSASSTPRSPMDGSSSSSSNTRALLDARRRTMGHKESGTGAAAAPPGTVLLQLSADDYGAALEGRLSAMLEQKVHSCTHAGLSTCPQHC
jgi:CRP-like cAMP-binding protein